MQYEMIDFNTHMPVRCAMYLLGHIERHLHDFFEIIFVLSGSCSVVINGDPFMLGEEDVLSIDGHTPHELRGSNCSIISVQFEQSIFEKTLPDPKHPSFNCNSAVQGNNASFDRLRRLIAQLVKNNVDKQLGYELRNWSIIYQVMDEFYNNFRVESSDKQDAKAHRYAARMAKITATINKRYTENLTLSELAQEVFLSAPYLSKFFDQQFGMTFLAYLTRVRLNHAMEELLYTEHTMDAIAEHSGFPNVHAFVRAFRKEYNDLPSIYRRNFQRKDEAQTALPVEQHDYMSSLKKYLEQPEERPIPSDQVLVCSAECSAAAPVKALRHCWKTLLNVGQASDLLYADVQEMVRQTQREIGFKYIRLSDIFSDELNLCFRGMNGRLTFSFTSLDKIIDFILGVGLRPFVQLSFMPAALAKNPGKRVFGHLVSEPKSLDEWCELVEAVVRHLLNRYENSEVRQWLFCVWTQPESPKYLYAFSREEDFCQFYFRTWQTVKRCDDQLCFGSPSFYNSVSDAAKKGYLSFQNWCRDNQCEPDFLNLTYFDAISISPSQEGENGKQSFGFVGSMALNQTPDGFPDFVEQNLAVARTQLNWSKPIYLTEWNSTPSQQDLLNDTCFKSCYIARCILEEYDRLDSFGYWSLTDWMNEAPLPKELFFGGLGLFTVNGIPKASYHVFKMMNSLGDTLLGKGPGWFVTCGNGEYQVILYNYRHYSYLYALGERFDMTFTDRYTPFSPEQILDVHLKLNDVADGTYLVRETLLNRRHGSAFDIWNSMGAIEFDTREEIDYLKARATPARRKYFAEATGGTLELNAWLDMLEVRLLVIRRQTEQPPTHTV